ncbi:MAG TPA: class I SAM-dependent methyltransferase [Steroidobacteraceae bacterium]|nr:class I SAM-dependent methyltransferase [Steroidobacteraceae bacterium]
MDCEPSGPAVHHAALEGFSREARSYGRGRPDYPQQLALWLQQTLQLGPGKSALDLGAGTGKFTRLLLQSGASVVAIEPVDAMRAQLLQNCPGVAALAATAQSMPVAEASVDAVICAQAFHWFASLQALREIGRVLRSGGRLGLVWNVRDESVDWVGAITRIIAPYEGDTPRFHTGEWRRLFPNELFSELAETTVPYQHLGSAQVVILERVLSVSFIAALPASERAGVAAQLESLIATHPQLRDRPTIQFPYVTHAYASTRAPRPAQSGAQLGE